MPVRVSYTSARPYDVVPSWVLKKQREDVVADMLQYLKLIPGYALDVIALLLGPKRFLATGSAVTPENLTKALLFFLISSVIALIVRAYGIESPTEFTTQLLRSAVAWGASLLVTAAVIAASWAMVRRPVAVQAALLIQAYIVAIVLVILNVSIAAEVNLLAMYRPEVYDRIRAIYGAQQFDYREVGSLAQSHPLSPGDSVAVGIQAIQLLTLAAIFAWLIVTWGAYRHLTGASRTRSALAFIVSFALCMPMALVGALVTRHGFSLR
jgi:hypothetical protein